MKNKLLFYFQFLLTALNYLFNKNFNEKQIINKHLNNESIVFDVGSNVGAYTKFVSNTLKNKKIYFHSFEPNNELCTIQDKIKFPDHHSLLIKNRAISNKAETFIFYERSISSHSSLIENPQIDGLSKTISEYEVETLTLEKYCKVNDINNIDLLKIDAEGLDYEVLISCGNLLINRNIKLIKIEIFFNNQNLSKISSLLEQNNYELIGLTNLSYFNGKLEFADAYFSLN